MTSEPRPPLLRRIARRVLAVYMRVWHSLEVTWLAPPPTGPLLVLINHASLLDVPALMVVDPFPNTMIVVKASLFRVPLVKQVLETWSAVPAMREGRDTSTLRQMLGALRQGRVVAVAAEGRRTRSGRLEQINPVLARLAASARVPILPVGISGTFAALPPGAFFPRRRKIVVRIGKAFTLPPGTTAEDAATRIRAEITALLAPEHRPLEAEVAPAA